MDAPSSQGEELREGRLAQCEVGKPRRKPLLGAETPVLRGNPGRERERDRERERERDRGFASSSGR